MAPYETQDGMLCRSLIVGWGQGRGGSWVQIWYMTPWNKVQFIRKRLKTAQSG